jgi:DNA-binding IclR family transcriptional regulator
MQPMPAATLRTADRALQILQQFRRPGQAWTVSAIAEQLGLHRSTASRLISTLLARGFLERAGGEGLRLGPEAIRLGTIAIAGSELMAVAAPVIEALAQHTGEAVTLAVASGGQVLTVAEAPGRHFVSSRDWIGVATPAHCTADGKVLLAYGALAPVTGQPQPLTPATIVDATALEQELAVVRRRGWATAHGELELGLYGVAAPVHSGERCVAALCISGPEYRFSGTFEDRLAPRCLEAAGQLRRRLGESPGQVGPAA